MPKKKAVRKRQPKVREENSSTFHLSESYASFILGVVVVILGVVLGLSFFKKSHVTQQTSSTHTVALPPEKIQQTMNEISQTTYTVQDGDTLWSIAQDKLGSGFDWEQIAKANSISSSTDLEVGTKIVIPKGEQVASSETESSPAPTEVPTLAPSLTPTEMDTPTPTPTLEPSPTAMPTQMFSPTPQVSPGSSEQASSITGNSYTVVPGDTLWDIAVRAYGDGFRWKDIASANNLANPDLIFSGNVFTLPRS